MTTRSKRPIPNGSKTPILSKARIHHGCLDKLHPIGSGVGQKLPGALKQAWLFIESDNLAVRQERQKVLNQGAWAAAQVKHGHAILQSESDEERRFLGPGQSGLLTQSVRFTVQAELF